MTLWTSDPVKVKFARQYFASLNPMAARIIEAQDNVINSFSKEKWKKMPVSDQEKVLNQSIVTPEAVARYRSSASSSKLPKYYQSVFPKLIVETGQAYATCIDDSKEDESWKDEHSEPFSWETQSQMNIPLPFPTDKSVCKEKLDFEHIDALSDDMEPENFEKKLLNTSFSKHANGIQDTTRQSLKYESSYSRKISTGSQNGPGQEVYVDDVKIVMTQPGASGHHAKKEPVDSTNSTGRLFNLQSKDIRRPVTHQRQKSTGRINPRSSLTLDGAIRNLEVAMREEHERVIQARKASSSRSSSGNISSTESSDKVTAVETLTKPEDREESPLLEFSEPLMESEKEENEVIVKKSGFDFLDNW